MTDRFNRAVSMLNEIANSESMAVAFIDYMACKTLRFVMSPIDNVGTKMSRGLVVAVIDDQNPTKQITGKYDVKISLSNPVAMHELRGWIHKNKKFYEKVNAYREMMSLVKKNAVMLPDDVELHITEPASATHMLSFVWMKQPEPISVVVRTSCTKKHSDGDQFNFHYHPKNGKYTMDGIWGFVSSQINYQ